MRAAIEALNGLKRLCPVELYTDSSYLRDGITKWVNGWQRNGWRTASKQPVKNQDLWRALLAAVTRHAGAGGVEWRWTKGHAGNAYNERADILASLEAARTTADDPVDAETSPQQQTGSLL